jgi:PAS domain S-box-containing protein
MPEDKDMPKEQRMAQKSPGSSKDLAALKTKRQALIQSMDQIKELLRLIVEDLGRANQRFHQEPSSRRLRESEVRFSILDNSFDVIYCLNLRSGTYDYVSPSSERLLGYTPQELITLGLERSKPIIHPDDYQRIKGHFFLTNPKSLSNMPSTGEYRIRHKTLGYRWVSDSRTILFENDNEPVTIVGNVRDISKQKHAEEELKKVYDELEKKVRERTENLEEVNTALRVLLKRREEDRAELEDKILNNVKDLVIPYLRWIEKGPLDARQRVYLEMMESNLNNIISPFIRDLSNKFLSLTPTEIRIANLIKEGMVIKEIAEILNLSPRTVEFHRENLRAKLGIKNKKVNLRTFLQTIR